MRRYARACRSNNAQYSPKRHIYAHTVAYHSPQMMRTRSSLRADSLRSEVHC